LAGLRVRGELGYFSLKELQEAIGQWIADRRDLHFEPKTLKELMDWHEQQRKGEE